MSVVLVLVSSGCFGAVLGVITLSPCGSDRTAEVIQGSHNTFTCSGLDSRKQVQWTLSYNNINNSGGYCDPDQECVTGSLGSVSTPSKVSSTEVRTVIDPTKLFSKDLVKIGTLKCTQENGAASCQMDYIVPVRGTCSVQAGRDSSRYQLDGGCTLQSGAESSRNRYSCQWRSHGGTQWDHNIKLTEDNYQTACTVSGQPLPSTTGQYTYTVTLLPGRNTVNAAGVVSITRPDAPSVPGCGGDDYIPENTAVTCTCSTTTIGQPQGRLLWIKDGDSSATQTGAYGASSLTVSQTLHRDDHQRSQFGCAVQWTANISGPTVTFKVGYPPTQVSLQLNQGDADIAVTEHQTVDFSCQDSNGRPDPTLRLLNKDNSSVLASELSALSHEVVERCEDSGQYVCTADNGMGSKFTGKSLALFVACAPRGSYDVGEANFISQPVSVTFDVTAYPVPDEVTFRYLGPNDTSAGSPDDDIAPIQMYGTCHAKPGVLYQSTCTVTVTNVAEDTAAGFYGVTIRNRQGHGEFRLHVLYRGSPTQVSLQLNQGDADITVTEHQTVDFSCQDSNGRPDTTLSLLNKDNSSVLASELSALRHEVVGRCEDSGQYVCTADNGMGSKFTGKALALFVTCSPRGGYDVGKVNFVDKPVSVTFAVTAYPVPDKVTFRYLGPSITSESHPMDINGTHIQLTAACGPWPGVAYQSTCTVTVTAMTTQSAAGFYLLLVTNTKGRGEFRLKVLYRAPEVDFLSHPGVVVAMCVASFLVIVAVVIICLWRRQWKLPCAETPIPATPSAQRVTTSDDYVDAATPDYAEPDYVEPDAPHDNVEPIPSPDEYLEPTSRRKESAGPYESLQMADVGLRSVYSEITPLGRPRLA